MTLTIRALQDAYRLGSTTVRREVARFVEEADRRAPSAWIHRADADALEAAAQVLDDRLAREGASLLEQLPLFGVLFAVKDNIDVSGMPTTAAFTGWTPAPAPAHAAAVQRLVDAGALPVGKTNLDQFATGLVGTRSPYGAVPNAFSPRHVSGGSSSGSAYVVATGQVAFALGTDTAGSGRVPAAFNNVVGLKPTPGRVSTRGVFPACRSLDCVSVFALTADDAALVLSQMEGPDPDDAYSAFVAGRARFGDSLRIGVPAKPSFGDGGAFEALFAQATERLEAMGHTVVPIDFEPLHRTAALLYDGPWVAERHAAVQHWLDTMPDAFDPAVRRIVANAAAFSATDAFRGLYALRAAQRKALATWDTVDLLMVPTAPSHPELAEVANEPLAANARLGTYTNFVNLLGWCALALPSGMTAQGLPFGVTFIAPAASDAALAAFGHAWQSATALPLGATGVPLGLTPYTAAPAVEPALALAVVGAHLRGLPLNGQLTSRRAWLAERTTTSPDYRLFALPGTAPEKPGLLRTPGDGQAIEVEIWNLPLDEVGSFLALVPAPLGLGTLTLADGRLVKGFLCESHALDGAVDISRHGGWRRYLASR